MQEIGEQVERLRQMLIKYFHIERGGLPGGKGVHLATQRIDLARNVAGRPAGRAFEEHMFNEMGISGCAGCSSRDPALTQMPTVTDLRVGIRSLTKRTPFSRMSLRYTKITRPLVPVSPLSEPAWFPSGSTGSCPADRSPGPSP